MSVALVDFLFSILLATTGVAIGWWLRGGLTRAAPPRDDAEARQARQAREVLAGLHELAARVAADVGEHSNRVEEINEELSSGQSCRTDDVMRAVTQLIAANNQMQQRLASSETRLQEQARLIETHAAEARTDPLTGLANRRALDDELSRCFAAFQRSGLVFSLIMLDVDHFKRFNDTQGHQAGDEVLRGMARILRRYAREMDLVARYGGEEFAVVLPGINAKDAAASAQRIRAAIDATHICFQSADLHVTASLGIAEVVPGEDVATLIQRADAALYASKKAGRNRVHRHDGHHIQSVNAAPETPAPANLLAAAKDPAPPETPRPAPAPPSAPATSSPAEVARVFRAGLCNRTELCIILARRMSERGRNGPPVSVLLIRIDGFAEIVARRGSRAANMAMRAAGQFLAAAVRDMDLVALYDEATFAVLLPSTTLMHVAGVAERLREAVARTALTMDNAPLRFTLSLGYAEACEGDDTKRLLLHAEEALQRAIKAGGNTSYFHTGTLVETASAALDHVAP